LLPRKQAKYMTADDIISKLNLEPLDKEGGFFKRVYTHSLTITDTGKTLASAIYYLLKPDNFSAMHRLTSDEIFHFYCGDSVEMLMLSKDHECIKIQLGNDLNHGQLPMKVVPAGTWQGSRILSPNLGYALLGVSVHPAFRWQDFELAERHDLIAEFPSWKNDILLFTK
jgi:uncharacterized protein